MIQKLFLMITLFVTTNALSQEADLQLPGARWIAKASHYLCKAFEGEAAAPVSHQLRNIQFEQITTDRTLDNGLIKATFEEKGELCRYSAIMFADNAAKTIELVSSKAYAPKLEAHDCSEGQALLDEQLKFNDYLYWGHPHHLTILAPVDSAEISCGAGATHIGIDFIVTGKIKE